MTETIVAQEKWDCVGITRGLHKQVTVTTWSSELSTDVKGSVVAKRPIFGTWALGQRNKRHELVSFCEIELGLVYVTACM